MTHILYGKIILLVVILLVAHIVLMKKVQQFRCYLKSLAIEKDILRNSFKGFRFKVYTFWLLFVLWFTTRAFGIEPLTRLFKAGSGFFFCLVLGETACILFLTGFRNLIQDLEGFYPMLKKVIWGGSSFLGIIVAGNNLGYSLGGLLTTLGVGGAAVAFAAQTTLANLWAALSILLDHPFKKGDNIVVGSRAQGVVENIGLRSTRLRTPKEEIVVIPNSVIVSECIINMGEHRA
jgi:small-conductance mechanosensitive channel